MNNYTRTEELSEEFNNFMLKVDQVNSVVKKLNSNSLELQEMGIKEADLLLMGPNKISVESLGDNFEEKVQLQIKSSRTLINPKAVKIEENPATQTPDAFMEEVSKDAERRYKDKLVRREKMETFKMQATKAFRRKDFPRALSCYTKAIEQIKDSPLLYNNRAIVYIELKMFDQAIKDAEMALRLNEDCLKSFLLIIKAAFYYNNIILLENNVQEAKKRYPKKKQFIDDFVANL